MADVENGNGNGNGNGNAERVRKRDIAAKYMKQGLDYSEKQLKKAVGLGASPNVVPEDTPLTNVEHRELRVGWHPVGGFAGKWFAKETGLGRMITEKINSYPDPTQHWAVLVGGYAHQLWMDENFNVIYTNAVIVEEEWTTYPVGSTRFNDDAIRRTGEHVIAQLRETKPAYNLITNNCQTYALLLLDAIKADGEAKFPTTQNVYDRLTGPGKVIDLFKPSSESPEAAAIAAGVASGTGAGETVTNAQSVMTDHTAQVDANAKAAETDSDTDRSRGSSPGAEQKEDAKKKDGIFKRLFRKKETP